MKKMITCLVLMVMVSAVKADEMDLLTLTINDVTLTTNTAKTVTAGKTTGYIEAIYIDVSGSANMDLDLVDYAGTVIYSKDDVTTDVVFTPIRMLAITPAGTSITNSANAYARIPYIAPLTLTASDEASTNKNVTVKVIVSK